MAAHFAGEDGVFFSHAIFDESMAAFRDERLRAMSFANFDRGPNHAWIKDDFVIVAVFCQQNVRE